MLLLLQQIFRLLNLGSNFRSAIPSMLADKIHLYSTPTSTIIDSTIWKYLKETIIPPPNGTYGYESVLFL
jgi:hypothetical protein